MLRCLFTFFILCTGFSSLTQTPPKRELRAAWIATYLNLDWPTNASQTPDQERTAFINLLNTHKQTGINAVFVQLRSECDAMYPSTLEPWGASLTGTQGTPPSPYYDPLQFMIDECRIRGIEFHAWFNPYRAVNNFNNINNFAANHIAKTKPEWLLAQGIYRLLDPGIPAVRDYVISVVMDVLRRYNVDGIHFDDYFYPYASQGGSPTPPRFNDDATFALYPRGFTNQNDWRRDNVNLLIQRTYDSIITVKPWVKFGISPFGIWRNQSSDPLGSLSNGLQSYSDLFADSRKWMQNSWVDYLMPQIYWSIGFAAANYGVLAPWWNNNAFGRHIYTGHAVYKVANDPDANWNNPSQINNQIRLNRQHINILGSCFFRTGNLISNPLNVRDSLRVWMYYKPALLPTMSWRDNTPPQPATNLIANVIGNTVELSWAKPPSTANELDKARQFVVYRFNSSVIDLTDVNAIQFITPNDVSATYTDANLSPGTYYYVVTALDRFHNESTVTNAALATVVTTSILSPELRVLNLKNYPNPFSSHTQISFELLKPMYVSLKVYDINGRELMELVNGNRFTGKQLLTFDGSKLPAGVYYVTLRTKEFTKTIQLLLTK